jgi:hypothetical protein
MCFRVYARSRCSAVELQLKLNRMAQTTLRVTEADGDSDRMIVAPLAKTDSGARIIELERCSKGGPGEQFHSLTSGLHVHAYVYPPKEKQD